MFTVFVVLLVIIFVKLLLVTGVVPLSSDVSLFELRRRDMVGEKEATAALRRESLLPDILSLQRIIGALLLVGFVILSVVTFEWLLGTILAVIVAIEYGAIARLPIVRGWSQRLYDRYEVYLLHFVEKFPKFFRVVRSATPELPILALHSKQELEHLVSGSQNILSVDEKNLITNGLQFNEKLVSEVMTPRSVIDSIGKKELLGPLVLDNLHKTGHSRFPVMDGDVDHIVGMLYVQSLLILDGKKQSHTAEKSMEPQVFYIKEDQSLQHALAAFLRTHHHLFIVVNEFQETVGLLSFEDVIEALLGRKVNDEFDTHDDLRAVALRNPRANNRPEVRTNV